MVEIVPVHALPSVLTASDAQTLIEVLEWHEARLPQRLHLIVLQETILGSLTYAELATKARALARRLAARDVREVTIGNCAMLLPATVKSD